MPGYVLAAVLAATGVIIHAFVGSRAVVAPLLAVKGLAPASRWLMFLCWHGITIVLVALAAGFGWAAWSTDGADVGIGLTVLTAALAVLTLYVCRRARFNPLKVPPFVLFSLMAAAGSWSAAS